MQHFRLGPYHGTQDLCRLTATGALAELRAGLITAEALARSCLQRVVERDPLIRAWTALAPDRVLAAARDCDKLPADRPLHGIPVGVKDVIDTADFPTQYNSPLYRDHRPARDAACVAILRAAGAVIFGKTDTVEFAAGGRLPLSRNPHDPAHTPGGSSSGSAAAVADGHVPIALGTQSAGSVIRPASYCGVFAMKPSWGLVGREGIKSYAPSLDTPGWFARSVTDLALIAEILGVRSTPHSHRIASEHHPATSGHASDKDARKNKGPEHFPANSSDSKRSKNALAGARIGVCRTPAWADAQPATVAAMAQARRKLRAAGAEIVELELPPAFDRLIAARRTIARAEGAASFLAEAQMFGAALHPGIRALVTNRTETATDLRQAHDLAASCRASFDDIAAEFAAVVAPSAPGEAPEGLHNTGDPSFNELWTLLHVPCINVPGCVGPLGMPVGLSLIGPRYADFQVLAMAQSVADCIGPG